MSEDGKRNEFERLRQNLRDVRATIAQAAAKAGTDAATIRLVAVTKTLPIEQVRAAALAGIDEFGENYAQEAVSKADAFVESELIRWHFIGHLQTNKVAALVGKFSLIQSVDRLNLARKIGIGASNEGIVQDVLLQAHLGKEESKGGVDPARLPAFFESVSHIGGVRVLGLMGIAPLTGTDGRRVDPRPYFDSLRELFDRLPAESRKILSMGMSGDYIAAISAGSNMVRIGSALFGPRLQSSEAIHEREQ